MQIKTLLTVVLIAFSCCASAMTPEDERVYVLGGHQLLREEKYDEAKAIFESVAHSLNAVPKKIALMALGDMAFVGWAGPVDYGQAIEWYAQVLDLSRIAPVSAQEHNQAQVLSRHENRALTPGTVTLAADCLACADDFWFSIGTHESVWYAWQLYAHVATGADTVEARYWAQVRLQTMYHSMDRHRVPRWWWRPRNDKGLTTCDWWDDHIVLTKRLQDLMNRVIFSSQQAGTAQTSAATPLPL